MNFKQPTIKDNQMRPEVLMMVTMKNSGFWEVRLIFLRNIHQYVARFLPYNMMSHTGKWDSWSAIRHFSAWITLHCYKCLNPRVHHTGCPENLGFHNTAAFNTHTNVKTEARDVQSPANNSTGNTLLVLHVWQLMSLCWINNRDMKTQRTGGTADGQDVREGAGLCPSHFIPGDKRPRCPLQSRLGVA